MNLDYLEELVTIVKHGNLSEAAKELHESEPVLSRHLKTIETEAGFSIFDRTTSPMRLTPLGETFMNYVYTIVTEYVRLKDFLRTAHTQTKTEIKLRGLIDETTQIVIKKLIKEMSARDLNSKLALAQYSSKTPFDSLRSKEIDIAIEPYSEFVDLHALRYIHIAKEDTYVVMETTNPMTSKEEISVDDLTSMSFTSLRSNRDTAMRKQIMHICHLNGIEGNLPLRIALAPVDTYDELFMRGLEDQFLMLPESLAKRYAGSEGTGYVAKKLKGSKTEYDICAFCLADANNAVKEVIDLLEEITYQECQVDKP